MPTQMLDADGDGNVVVVVAHSLLRDYRSSRLLHHGDVLLGDALLGHPILDVACLLDHMDEDAFHRGDDACLLGDAFHVYRVFLVGLHRVVVGLHRVVDVVLPFRGWQLQFCRCC